MEYIQPKMTRREDMDDEGQCNGFGNSHQRGHQN